MFRTASAGVFLFVFSAIFICAGASAQMSAEDLAALQAQAEQEQWTFKVGETSATQRPKEWLQA